MSRIDLNCDLGERLESILDGTDEALLGSVTSANVACGGHAGDETTMDRTVRAAARAGVAVGAHPGYPDRLGFGRAPVETDAATIEDLVLEQVRALATIADRAGIRLGHVKPHGALYHDASNDARVARAIGAAVSRHDPALVLVGLAASPALRTWKSMGLRVAAEGFADRRYEADGTLRSRSLPGALLTDPGEAAEQAVRLARGPVETLCVHSDTPGAPELAREVRRALEAAGFRVVSLSAS